MSIAPAVRRRAVALAVLLLAPVLAVLRPDAAGAVGTAAVTVTLHADKNPSATADKPVLTAVVTPVVAGAVPTGTVTFKDGSMTIGSDDVDGTGTAVLSPTVPPFVTPGSHTITAEYGGDSTYTTGTSVPRTQTVEAQVTTRTWTGPAGGNWSTGANWNPAGAPATGDTLVLDGAAAASSVDDIDVSPGHISFVNGSHTVTGTGTITLRAAATGIQAATVHNEGTGTGTLATKVSLATGQHVVDSRIVLSGVVSGAGGIDKTGADFLDLSGANTYTGTTDVKNAELRALSAGALGATSGGTTVEAGATLTPQANSAEPLTLNGDGVSPDRGALNPQSVTLSGTVALNGAQVSIGGVGATLTGVVSGSSILAKTGANGLGLSGANTFSGGVDIKTGWVVPNSGTALGTGAVTLESGALLDIRTTAPIANALTGAGGGVVSRVDGARLTGNVTLNSPTALAAGDPNSLELDGTVSGAGTLSTTGNVFLSGANANTFTGLTTVSGGVLDIGKTNPVAALPAGATVVNGAELHVDNDQQIGDSAPVSVAAGGVLDELGSDDTFGSLASAGTVFLGLPQADRFTQLNVGSLNLTGGELDVAIAGTSPGVDQDQIKVTGTTPHLAGALAVDGDVPFGATVKLIDNATASPVFGTFAGLPEGASVQTPTRAATISYRGGDGNDVTLTERAARSGYWMLGSDGKVYPFGDAKSYGDMSNLRLSAPVVSLEPTPDFNGYWILSADGGVFSFGDAKFLGSVGGQLDDGETATSMSSNGSNGYWIFTDEGRAFAFGDAEQLDDMSGVPLNGPVLGSVGTPSGEGYYMVASDGGIFAFGDAVFRGSMGGKPLNGPVVGLAPDPDGDGYWLVATDGGIFAFNAGFRGSMGGTALNQPVVGMVAYGDGYLMVATDGGIFDFSSKPFAGSLGDHPPANPVIAVAALNEH